MAASAADHSLSLMLNSQRLNRLAQQHADNDRVPSPAGLMTAIFNTVFSDWENAKKALVQQRLLATAINAEVRAVKIRDWLQKPG